MVADEVAVHGGPNFTERDLVPHGSMKTESSTGGPAIAAMADHRIARQQDQETASRHERSIRPSCRQMGDGGGEELGVIVIVVIELVEDVAASRFDADVQLGSRADRGGEPEVADVGEVAT